MSRELIKPAEYARRRGVSKAAVSFAIKRCSIPLVDGKLDPLVADTLWKARTDPLQQQRGLGMQRKAALPEAVHALVDDNWRMRRERAEAQIAELELQEKAGKLVDAEAANRKFTRFLAQLGALLDNIPDAISAEFGVDDAHRLALRTRLIESIARARQESIDAARLDS